MAIHKAYIDTPSGQMHYRYGGPEGGVPILFLHQNVSSGAMFENTMARLEGAYRVLALDFPGFGGSYEPPKFATISYLTEKTLEAMDALGIEAVHVCGQHTGACVAAELGAKHRERVRTVTMIGPLQLTDDERAWYRENFKGSAAPDTEGNYLGATWEYLRGLGANATVELHHGEMWQALRAWQARGWVYDCVWDFDFEGFFREIRSPILLMAATDDVLYPGFERARETRPDADTAIVGGANFEPILDPEGTAAGIRNFLKKHQS